jgi:pimeloyl-ACP methyl ester carboxylesterase
MPATNNVHLEYQLIGKGETNIVFLNGFRIQFNSWDKVYPKLAEENGILLFNRRGVGKSSKATIAQDGMTVIGEMHSLFFNLSLSSPYLLVAHSLGGIFANYYARVYPNEVAGVVFVDCPHPSEIAEQKRINPPIVLSATINGMKAIEKLFDKLKYSEDECIEDTLSQMESLGHFPDVPIGIVSGAKKMPFVPDKAFEIHQSHQTKMLDLTSKSKHYICHESGHFPQITEPEKVIVAIRDTLNATKIF